MLKKNQSMSFYRAVHEGYIKGPDWAVVDSETGEKVCPGNQNFGYLATHKVGRAVLDLSYDILPVPTIDYQEPQDNPVYEYRTVDL
jgi:hypothetical protein